VSELKRALTRVPDEATMCEPRAGSLSNTCTSIQGWCLDLWPQIHVSPEGCQCLRSWSWRWHLLPLRFCLQQLHTGGTVEPTTCKACKTLSQPLAGHQNRTGTVGATEWIYTHASHGFHLTGRSTTEPQPWVQLLHSLPICRLPHASPTSSSQRQVLIIREKRVLCANTKPWLYELYW
jgi:hypothetical protein